MLELYEPDHTDRRPGAIPGTRVVSKARLLGVQLRRRQDLIVDFSRRELGPEHRKPALRFGLCRFVLEHVPVFREGAVDHAEDICRDPAFWPAMSREPAVEDHEHLASENDAGLVMQ